MSNKTVLQSIIEKQELRYANLKKQLKEVELFDPNLPTIENLCNATAETINILKAHLPAEKQMIMDAWNDGSYEGNIMGAETYYNQTFLNPLKQNRTNDTRRSNG